jgi:putative ABC transport system substrate-binding protein
MLFDQLKRREFITLLGGAMAWPLAARAQERVRHVGMLTGGSVAGDADAEANKAALLQTLQQLGWIEGRNLRLDVRWGGGNLERIRHHAADMAALAPDVILVSGATPLAALLQATRTVPIVFVNIADPVGGGFVRNLSRPGGNATGFIQYEYSLSAKWLELLKEIAPLGLAADVFVVGTKIVPSEPVSAIAAVAVLALFLGLWQGLPRFARRRRGPARLQLRVQSP